MEEKQHSIMMVTVDAYNSFHQKGAYMLVIRHRVYTPLDFHA